MFYAGIRSIQLINFIIHGKSNRERNSRKQNGKETQGIKKANFIKEKY